jgi:arginyl-tRNA synthetase
VKDATTEALLARLSAIVGDAFERAGFDRAYGIVEPSSRPDLGQFQCNGALPAAKAHRQNPRAIASTIESALAAHDAFGSVSIAGPGFINLTLDDGWLADHVGAGQGADGPLAARVAQREMVLIDFGGANVAKPLHVGHLRSAIIGEALKRIGRFMGHEVIGDVHLGDWGLQMGMLIHELSLRRPDLPYFAEDFEAPGSAVSPVTVADLEELYPAASARAKDDAEYMEAARRATLELQRGRAGYSALWRHIVDVSIVDLAADYGALDVEFDLWLGESDAEEDAVRLVADLEASGAATNSRGALVIEVAEDSDPSPMPPLLLRKSDGAFLYGTTDLATIAQRVRDYDPALILYIVDARQATHLEQVFRAAHRVGVAPERTRLEHMRSAR